MSWLGLANPSSNPNPNPNPNPSPSPNPNPNEGEAQGAVGGGAAQEVGGGPLLTLASALTLTPTLALPLTLTPALIQPGPQPAARRAAQSEPQLGSRSGWLVITQEAAHGAPHERSAGGTASHGGWLLPP